jgi:hypothetical protein
MSHYFPAAKPSQPTTRIGRPKGSKNKAGESIRWGLVEAYRQLGGVDGLVKWGKKPSNRGEFYKLLVKVIPVEMAEAGLGQDNKIQVIILPANSPSSQTDSAAQADSTVQVLEIAGKDSGMIDAEVQSSTVCAAEGRGTFRQAGASEREPEG